jgi:sugar phosphate isomerase/epimerase
MQPDHGRLIGMSLIAGREDIETASRTVKELGFEGMEVHGSQIGPGMPGVPIFEAHAAAAGEVVRRAGLMVSTLNVVGDSTFEPFGGASALGATIDGLAAHMRWAAAMGAPRVLIFEGRVARREDVEPACKTLEKVIDSARRRSGLSDPPRVSVELHPFTFGLKFRMLSELASSLRSVGAGICFDFCHFGVALGRDLVGYLDDGVVDAIDHIHYCDTDTTTSELHFPPGEGVLDLEAIGDRMAGKPIAASWDLFGWPGPRHTVKSRMDIYRRFVERHVASVRHVSAPVGAPA